MNVSVYSREAIEFIIAAGNFPKNTAVISFYDPAIKRIDEDYSHVDYSGVCNTVFYSELDDLDLDVLRRKGYTYDTYFPEAPDIAAFIYRGIRYWYEYHMPVRIRSEQKCWLCSGYFGIFLSKRYFCICKL